MSRRVTFLSLLALLLLLAACGSSATEPVAGSAAPAESGSEEVSVLVYASPL